MTPTDSAEKVVADHERIWLQNVADGEASGEGRLWCQDKVWPVDENDGEPTEYVRADIYASALALIESQRATIEGHASEIEKLSKLVQFWIADSREAHDARQAAEARVTALEAEKAGVVDERDELREIVNEQFGEELGGDKNLTPIRGSYHTFISWELRRRARQALSRSSTEVKNDGA